jgi:hypothetical protein
VDGDSGGYLAGVAMMESTEHGQGDYVALFGCFNCARFRSILVQRPVGAVLVMIAQVIRESPPQVLVVEHDHMVQTFAAEGADQSLDAGILPGRAWCNELLFQTEAKGTLHKFQTVNAVAIPKEIAGDWA